MIHDTNAEHDRVDALFNEARSWSHKSWALAAITVVLVGIGIPEVQLGGLNLEAHLVLPFLYGAVIVICLAAFYYRRLARRHQLKGEEPRTPHPWLLLSLPEPLQVIAIAIPVVATGIAAESRIPGPYGGLTFAAVALLGTDDMLGQWGRLIRARVDERGGPATFSIFLLYFLRAGRHVWFMLMLLSPLLWRWKELAIDVVGVSAINGTLIQLVRFIGALTYGPINRFGARVWGFPETSVHSANKKRSEGAKAMPDDVPDQRDGT